jgi:3',5'-cyclic AMP phosphodiesterase CpdA
MIDALVISDLHYVRRADHVCPIAWRRSDLGPLLVRDAYQCLCARGIDIDVLVVLGDVVDNGLADGAEHDLEEVAEATRSLAVPVLAVPGNHDGPYDRVTSIFGCRPGLHEVGGYGFLVFHDYVGKGEVTTRPSALLGLPTEIASASRAQRRIAPSRGPLATHAAAAAAQRAERRIAPSHSTANVAKGQQALPLVALQHNPLYVTGQHDYPYVLTNAGEVLDGYREAGVVLSLSGHYHPGQPMCEVRGVRCYTVPAACERPFRFAHVRLEGRDAQVTELALDIRLGPKGLPLNP